MKIRGFLFLVAAIPVLALSAPACTTDSDDDDDDGFGPGPLVSIAISGGTTVVVGSSVQLTATGTFENATTGNITTTAVWATSNAGIATVSATGFVSGVAAGNTTITATRDGIVGLTAMAAVVAIPTPPPGPAIDEISSFVADNGNELWLCYSTQFDGTIQKIFTDDGGTCTADLPGIGVTSTFDYNSYYSLRIPGLTGCGPGNHDWYFDYVPDDARCTPNCVAVEYNFALDASSDFGTLCGSAGVGALTTIITDVGAYRSANGQAHRFHMDIGPAGSVSLQTMLIYDVGGGLLKTECTVTATIVSNGSGLFEPTCTPDAATVPLTVGSMYDAMIFGTLGGTETFAGSITFDYETTPVP